MKSTLLIAAIFSLQEPVPTQVVCAVRHTPQGVEEHPVHVSQQGKTIMFRTTKYGQNVWMTFSNYVTYGNVITSVQMNDYSNMYFRMVVNRGRIESLEVCDGGNFLLTYGVAFDMARPIRQWE